MFSNNSDITDNIRYNHEDHRIQRCNLILEGINLITSTGLQETTKEEQINVCLSVALEITGSQIGFIGKVDFNGLLKEVAISDKVNNCNKYHKSGKQRPYRDFILNCLHGNVTDTGKSFLTNWPLSHTDSAGVQYKYPSLTSFLGVPLIEKGKAIGVLAVANREGGYSCEQREDLEAIAPTVTQALRRIKEEQELKYVEKILQDAYEQIQTQTDELQMQSDELQMKNEKLLANSNEIRVINAELEVKSEEVQNANETLEMKVKQRTEELEKAYVSLKESKKSLVDAQEMAHIGSWEQNFATKKLHWSDETYRIFGLKPQEFEVNFHTFLNYVHPDDQDKIYDTVKEALDGNPFDTDFRIIPAHGEERIIHSQGEVAFDEKSTPVRMRGTVQDITESKRREDTREAINSINKIIHSTLDFDEIMKKAVSEAAKAVGCETAAISLKEDKRWIVRYVYRFPEDVIGTEMYDAGEAHAVLAIKTKKPVAINDAFNDERVNRDHMKKWGVRSVLVVPLITRDEVIGVLFFNYHKSTFAFDDNHLEFASQLASSISLALENSHLFENLKIELAEHKRAEEKLQKQAKLIDLSPDGIVTRQLDGTISFWSKGAQLLYGWTSQEALGQKAHTLLRTQFPQPLEQIVELVQQTGYWSGELTHFTKDGRQVVVQSRWQAKFDDQGNVIEIMESNVDITESKKAEEKIRNLANIVESSNDAIITRSLEGIITSWNKGAEQIYGYSAEEILGRPISIIEPDSLKGEKEQLGKMIKQGKKIRNYETSRLRKDGTRIDVSITLSPVFDASGELVAISAIARDITERIKAEEALANTEIARKQEIHHRIKNNLQVISSLLDLQAEQFRNREGIKDSEILEAFRESQNRVKSMALIHEELYKGENADNINFSSYIEKLTDNLFQIYKRENTEVSFNIDLEESFSFDMDTAVPLGIIVNEIISNSFKHAFIGKDKGEIKIRLWREEKDEFKYENYRDTNLTLAVSDDGIGIPDDIDIEDLNSLGLQLVIALVDQLDGELEIRRNNGTEFIIRFIITQNCAQTLTSDNFVV